MKRNRLPLILVCVLLLSLLTACGAPAADGSAGGTSAPSSGNSEVPGQPPSASQAPAAESAAPSPGVTAVPSPSPGGSASPAPAPSKPEPSVDPRPSKDAAPAPSEGGITEELAYEGVSSYCSSVYNWNTAETTPGMMYLIMGEETETEYQVCFRSYTGAFVYFYVDKSNGITRLVESVPALGIEEAAGTIDLYDYLERDDPADPVSPEPSPSHDTVRREYTYTADPVPFNQNMYSWRFDMSFENTGASLMKLLNQHVERRSGGQTGTLVYESDRDGEEWAARNGAPLEISPGSTYPYNDGYPVEDKSFDYVQYAFTFVDEEGKTVEIIHHFNLTFNLPPDYIERWPGLA